MRQVIVTDENVSGEQGLMR